MKKLPTKLIRFWITLTFIVTFGIGWITLSHSEKPAALTPFQNKSFVSGVEFTPIPNLEELTTNTQNTNTTTSPSISFTRSVPRLRAMGS